MPLTDICDELAGNYPRGFKFTGWHPNCRCHTETILLNGADFEDFIKAKREGRAYDITKARGYVAEPPVAFKAWVKGNAGCIAAAAKAGTTPYFIKDNQKTVDALLGQPTATPKPKAAPAAKEPTELEALAERIGIDVGEPMTHEQANHMKPNPHFKEDEQYQINCQCAVVAYELRRRGLDVEAYGNPGTMNYTPRWLSFDTSVGWITGDGKLPNYIYRMRGVTGRTTDKLGRVRSIYEKPEEVWLDFADMTKEPGRYHIQWCWKNSNKGHIITMEVDEKGRRSFYDPQTGKNSRSIATWFMDGRKCRVDLDMGIWGYRVDTLRPNSDIVEGVVKKAGSKAATPEIRSEVKVIFLKSKNGDIGTQAGATGEVKWHESYKSKDGKGKVLTDPKRIEESKASKTETQKFEKEMRMCKVIADNEHEVKYLPDAGRPQGETYDITIDGIKADLKCITGGATNIGRYAKKALTKQGGEAVVFELPSKAPEYYKALANAHNKYKGRIFFYIKGEGILKELK